VVLATLGVGVALAAPKHTFTSGETVSASELNATLADLDQRLTAAARPTTFGARIRMGAGCEVRPGTSGTPTWVSCTPQATGVSGIKFAPNTFKDVPVCTISPQSDISCSMVVNSAASATARCYFGSGASSSLADSDINLICTEAQP
jgi:hypothetical protein